MGISGGREINTPWQKLLLPNVAIWQRSRSNRYILYFYHSLPNMTFPLTLFWCVQVWPRGCSSPGSPLGILIAVIWSCSMCSCRQANILLSSFTALQRVTPPPSYTWMRRPFVNIALQTVTRPLPPRLHCRYTSYCVTLLEIAIPRHLRRVREPPKKLVRGMTCFLVGGFPSMASHSRWWCDMHKECWWSWAILAGARAE